MGMEDRDWYRDKQIGLVYGEGCGTQVKHAAENGERRTLLIARR